MNGRLLVLLGSFSVGMLLASHPSVAGNSEPTFVQNSIRKVTDSKGTTFYATWIANDPVGTVKPEFIYQIAGQAEKRMFAKPAPIKGTRPIKVSLRVPELKSAVAFEWRAFAGGGNNGNNDSTTVPDKGPNLANPFPGFQSLALSSPALYVGIVKDTNGTAAGVCKATLSGKGVLSGAITYIDGVFHFSDPLGDDARLVARVSAKGRFGLGPISSVNLDATFASDATTNRITLALADPGGGAVGTATLVPTNPAFTAKNPSPLAGRYTVLLPIDPAHAGDPVFPQGEGYAAMVVAPTGSVKFIGKLADGVKVSIGSMLDEADGLSLFVPLYHGTGGFLAGKLDFAQVAGSSDAAGTLRWSKPGPAFAKRPYDDGFATDLPAIVSRYAPLTIDGLTTYLYFPRQNTILATSLTFFSIFSDVFLDPFADAQPVMRFAPKTGILTGKQKYGAGVGDTLFGGVVFQEQNRIGGFTLEPLSGKSVESARSGFFTSIDPFAATLQTASGLPMTIPDNDGTGLSIPLTVNQSGNIVDCRISFIISHAAPGNLGPIKLVSPGGTVTYVSRTTTSSGVSAVDFPVSSVAGELASGLWKLIVSDEVTGVVGTLDSWSLKLTTQ